jgi:uncharacterized membrane protein
MYEGSGIFIDRRRGPDKLVKSIKWIVSCAWILIITVIVLASMAKPQTETFFDRLLAVKLHDSWDLDLIRYSFYLTIALFLLCIIGLIVNAARHRRRSDRFNGSLILLSIVSVAGIMLYLFYF